LKEKYKEKLKSVGGKVKHIGSNVKYRIQMTFLNLQYRMDQHLKISQFEKDIEKLVMEKAETEKEHVQEIDLLDVNIILLTKERNELREERNELNLNILALNKALEKLHDDLINTKADLIILKKEYGIN